MVINVIVVIVVIDVIVDMVVIVVIDVIDCVSFSHSLLHFNCHNYNYCCVYNCCYTLIVMSYVRVVVSFSHSLCHSLLLIKGTVRRPRVLGRV